MKQLQTPCFILDLEELERSVKGYQQALDANFKKAIVGYSVKTNSTPYCMKMAGEYGAWAEVVSHDEYELARLCGYPQNKIVYNGPMKSKETFLEAMMHGSIVNIETKRELAWLSELPADEKYKVGIRLNINISYVSPEDAEGDNDNSRFGFSEPTGEFRDAVEYIASLHNIELAGLHIHRTAHSRSIRFYENSIRFACETIRKYELNLDYLDVGGGFFGIFPNKPTYQQYSDAFYGVMKEYGLEDLAIIVEPGNALVASCYAFLSEVIDVKQVEEDLWFVTTDGSRNDVDPFFKKTVYMTEIAYTQNKPAVKQQIVSGCTCLEYDRMFTLENKPRLSIGDRIYYKNVGAYTMCLTPMFIRYVPNIYMKTIDGFKLIREKYSAKEFMMKNVLD